MDQILSTDSLLSKQKHSVYDEVAELSKTLSEEILRARDDTPERFKSWIENRLQFALKRFEHRVEDVAARSLPKSPICGYTETGRARHRSEYIRSFTGYGAGCDVCGGCHDDVPTEMTLSLGSHKFRLMIDLCRPCAKRLVETIEARLFDGRRRQKAARV